MLNSDKKGLKILSVPVDKGGCGWYRVRQPFESINKYTNSQAHVIDKEADDMIQVAQALCLADVLVVRQGGENSIEPLRGAADAFAKETNQKQGFHAKIVIDIDDNIELISPYSEHYNEYGTTDFYDRNAKKWIWQHGKTQGFDLVRNRDKVRKFMLGLRKADMITVTTQRLAEYARQFNKNVAVLPNTINTNVWWKPSFTENNPLRVGWSGGHSHYEDWYTIKEPLNKLMRKYNFKLIMAGTGFQSLIDEDLRKNVEEYGWVTFEAHSYRTMLLNLDIAIIPLANIPFNSYKSAIKWEEFSAAGIPSVVANVMPYKEIAKAENSMVYDTPEEFYKCMEALLESEIARKRIGLLAQNEILQNWTTKQYAKIYEDVYGSLLV